MKILHEESQLLSVIKTLLYPNDVFQKEFESNDVPKNSTAHINIQENILEIVNQIKVHVTSVKLCIMFIVYTTSSVLGET